MKNIMLRGCDGAMRLLRNKDHSLSEHVIYDGSLCLTLRNKDHSLSFSLSLCAAGSDPDAHIPTSLSMHFLS